MKRPSILLALAACLSVHASQPNIVILYADDLGYGDLGCYNEESKIPTPHLDKLAAGGMRFTDGHSSSGICTPSRYALLTGKHHWRDFHGIVNALGKSVFKPDQLTLPEMLQEQGYHTACIGKWHLGWDWDAIRKPDAPANSKSHTAFDWSKPVPDGPLDHGFDHYFGDTVINFPPYAWIEDNQLVKAPDRDLKKPAAKTKEGNWECRPGPALTDWDFYQVLPTLTEKAVDYVASRKDQDKPFFLFVPFPSPHAPIIPNDEFDGTSQAGPYGDFVHQTDDSCGRILRALKEAGLEDNTLVFFTADNGPEHYAYAREKKFNHWSSMPLRGLKRDIYEGGHRVPFIARWPGFIEAGSQSDVLISQTDLMATLATLVDYKLPDDAAVDSFDFVPFFSKEDNEAPRSTMVHNTYEGKYAYRDGDWLLIDTQSGYNDNGRRSKAWEEKNGIPADDSGPVELYNLATDLGQKDNLAAQHPEKVASLKKALKADRDRGHTAPRLR